MKYLVLLLAFVNFNCFYNTDKIRANENEYSERTRKIKTIVEYTESNGTRESRTEYAYDAEGNLTEIRKYKGQVELEINFYQYHNGKLVDKCIGLYEHFDPDDSEYRCAYSENIQYDGYGQKTKSIIYDTSSLTNPIIKSYIYHTQLNQVKVNSSTENKTYLGSDIYKYDSYNRLLNSKHLNEKGVVQKEIKYSYNRNGNLKKKIVFNEKNKLEKKHLYKYDHKDKLIVERYIQYSNTGKDKIKSEYDYNLFGNRIKETKYSNGKVISTKKREITYYDE